MAYPKSRLSSLDTCLQYLRRGPQYRWHFLREAEAPEVAVNATLETNFGDALCVATREGLGIVSSDHFVAADIAAGCLVTLPDDYSAESVPITALYLQRDICLPACGAL